jgi:hypothetical protein
MIFLVVMEMIKARKLLMNVEKFHVNHSSQSLTIDYRSKLFHTRSRNPLLYTGFFLLSETTANIIPTNSAGLLLGEIVKKTLILKSLKLVLG